MVGDLLGVFWIQFGNNLLYIFTSMFMSGIGLQFSFSVESLCGYCFRVPWPHKLFGNVSSASTLCNSLKRLYLSFLKVC